MSRLRATITRLAEDFAAQVLEALKGASLSELAGIGVAPTRGPAQPAAARGAAAPPLRPRRARRRGRRSGKDLQGTLDAILSTLRGSAEGMRSEQLQKALGLSKQDITGPLQLALANKTIKKRGQRRATTYFAA